mmetsp:Transcript_8671/g.18432  ORF Transcript_8671/g.18432 Transcript_8671/m.18432 type:complete len:209 (-) Transcript_8671:1435-2061(-)
MQSRYLKSCCHNNPAIVCCTRPALLSTPTHLIASLRLPKRTAPLPCMLLLLRLLLLPYRLMTTPRSAAAALRALVEAESKSLVGAPSLLRAAAGGRERSRLTRAEAPRGPMWLPPACSSSRLLTWRREEARASAPWGPMPSKRWLDTSSLRRWPDAARPCPSFLAPAARMELRARLSSLRLPLLLRPRDKISAPRSPILLPSRLRRLR